MKNELENKIMDSIKDGKLKLKSRYVFFAQKLGLGTAFMFSIVLSILFFNIILFYLKETDNIKYLSFGSSGISAFLESFPYLPVVIFIILIIISSYLISKNDISYSKGPYGRIIVLMVFFIVFFGSILTFTNLPYQIEEYSRSLDPISRMILPLSDHRQRGVSGIIFEKYDDYLILETPQGLRKVNYDKINGLEKGQFVVSIGSSGDFDFSAVDIKVLDKESMPAIRREINFKLGPLRRNQMVMPDDMFYFKERESDCLKDCFVIQKKPRRECFIDCMNNFNN